MGGFGDLGGRQTGKSVGLEIYVLWVHHYV
jgi:hypothetical protein